MLAAWTDKNSNGALSETANWMTVHTKPCPKCCARIHKDGGCMYVTCQHCRHGFCWMCMGTHHVWQCNAYKDKDAKNDGEGSDENDEVAKAQRAKNELERYLHYYQRFHGHDEAQTFARKQLDKILVEIDKGDWEEEDDDNQNNTDGLFVTTNVVIGGDATAGKNDNNKEKESGSSSGNSGKKVASIHKPVLLKEANEQLVECRRVLKYTYVFAYYHFAPQTSSSTPRNNMLDANQLQKEKECFEHHQGILEGLTEGLSKLTEKPRSEIDIDTRQDIVNRTRVIGQFIKNVLEYVDNGLV